MPVSRTNGRRLATMEHRIKALELRKKGLSIRKIAEMIGKSRSVVNKYLKDCYEKYNDLQVEKAGPALAMELYRLDDQYWALRDRIERGDPRAIEVALKVMDHRAKLMGLYPAIKSEVRNTISFADMTDEQLREEARRVGIPDSALPPPSELPAGELPGEEALSGLPYPDAIDAEVVPPL